MVRRVNWRAALGALASLCAVMISPPDASAGPVPSWQPLGGRAIGLGADDHLGAAVWHDGRLYAALESHRHDDAGTSEVTVSRYDPSVGAWVRVGGALNLQLGDRVASPALASAGGHLYVAFNEEVEERRWRVVVRRLEVAAGRIEWETVGHTPVTISTGRPALAAVGNTVWVAWAEQRSVRVARLQGDYTWVPAQPIGANEDGLDIRMVGTPTGAYLAILERGARRTRIVALTATSMTMLLVRASPEGLQDVAMTVLPMASGQQRLFVAIATDAGVQTWRTSTFGDRVMVAVAVTTPAAPARVIGLHLAIVHGAPHLAMLMLDPWPAVTVARLAWDEQPARIAPLAAQPVADLELGDTFLLQNQTGRPLLGVGVNRAGIRQAAMLVYNAERHAR